MATYDQILALPENVVGEIVDGALYTHPRPAPRHARAATRLTGELGPPFDRGKDGPGGWVILVEPELHLGGNVLVPDLAGWRRETMPELQVEKAYFEQTPDWVCEVLSPSTASLDRGPKRRVYAKHGVRHVWLLDPTVHTLEILELDGNGYRILDVFSGDEVVRAVPFDAIELELSALWAL